MLMVGTKDPDKLLNTQEFMLWIYNGGIPTWNAFIMQPRAVRRAILEYIGNGYLIIPDVQVGDRHFYLCHATHADTYVDKPVLFKDASGELKQHIVWDRIYPRNTHMSAEFDSIDYSELYVKYPKNTTMIFGHTPTTLFRDPAPDGRADPDASGDGRRSPAEASAAARETGGTVRKGAAGHRRGQALPDGEKRLFGERSPQVSPASQHGRGAQPPGDRADDPAAGRSVRKELRFEIYKNARHRQRLCLCELF